MDYRVIILFIWTLLSFSACTTMPGKYQIKAGLGTYYTDSYYTSGGCTSFKYYIGGSLKGHKHICGPVKVAEVK